MTALMMEKQGTQLTMRGKCEILLCYTHEVLFSCIVDQSSIQYALQAVCIGIAEQTVLLSVQYILTAGYQRIMLQLKVTYIMAHSY